MLGHSLYFLLAYRVVVIPLCHLKDRNTSFLFFSYLNRTAVVFIVCNMVKGAGSNIKLDIEAQDFLTKNHFLMNDEDLLIAELQRHIIC
jgi:hypothetical protein